MQYVRNLSDSVSTAWNSINPATLSGAIDVIVVEQEDGTLMCSPFHVRFGKFSLLRPYEKKVEFKVNGARQDYSMKLGEGGEAFFVFETTDDIPQSMQTSPISSPASSPSLGPQTPPSGAAEVTAMPSLQEPSLLALDLESGKPRSATLTSHTVPKGIMHSSTTQQKNGLLTPLSASPEIYAGRPRSGDWSSFAQRSQSDDILRQAARQPSLTGNESVRAESVDREKDNGSPRLSDRSHSPPPLAPAEAIERAISLSKELESVNIPSRVTESGDLMLDMTGFKNSEEEALRAEVLARRVLSNELQGNYDVGALFGMDEQGNLWIYSSEEAKEAAMRRVMESSSMNRNPAVAIDAASDPGYHSDDSANSAPQLLPSHRRSESDAGQIGQTTPPSSPGPMTAVGDPNRNYAKTLRLTSDQLKALDLQSGENTMSFTVNRSTCSAKMYLWKCNVPVVISDIDGTITKSDALGHVLNMIGRDWTHAGVAKLYSDIAANGYNIMYLTSRSVGQADTTRTYLAGIVQNGYRLPRGPTILSPDRTMAALRREIYLRKPEVFKMATLRDIRNLYGTQTHPFYAGFGNRLTDQISYRTVDVPRNRIFTINANAEVSLDLLSLNMLKLTYVNITEVVDHYFPPISTLVKGGGEEFTDFRYWRDQPLEMDEFSDSESDDDINNHRHHRGRPQLNRLDSRMTYDEDDEEEDDEEYDDDEYDDDEDNGEMGDSYISRNSMDDYGEGSVLSGDFEGEGNDRMMHSVMTAGEGEEEDEEEFDDEEEEEEDDEEDEHIGGDQTVQKIPIASISPDQPLPTTETAEEEEEDDEEEEEPQPERASNTSKRHLSVASASDNNNNNNNNNNKLPSSSSSSAAEDVDAEVITGVRDLVIDRPTPKDA